MVIDSLEEYQDNEEISRAQSIMKNISELVSKKLEEAEITAALLLIQREMIYEVCRVQ
jgi:hypothetical protein